MNDKYAERGSGPIRKVTAKVGDLGEGAVGSEDQRIFGQLIKISNIHAKIGATFGMLHIICGLLVKVS